MKLYIYLLLALLLFSGCDDFLDKFPENTVDVEEVDYTKTDNMIQPLMGMYARVRTENGLGRWQMIGILAVRGDDINKGSTASDQGELNYIKNFEYNQIEGYPALNHVWSGLYNFVLNCNSALIDLQEYQKHISEDDKLQLNIQYQAEVRFLRAYAYFYLTRLWGDIPLVKNNSDVLTNLEKTSRDDVYSYINEELDFCSGNLPALRPNEMPYKGQVTKYSALALKAKANADLNNWESVLNTTNEIVNSGKFELYPDFYDYFKLPGCLSNENLFELQFGVVGSTEINSNNWFEFQGPRLGFVGSNINGGWGFLTPTSKLEDLFKARGETVRSETQFLYAGTTTKEGDVLNTYKEGEEYARVINGKTYLPSTQLPEGKVTYGMGNNIRMLRYADVLLLNAEAKVRNNQNGDAPFNLVRERAKMPALTNVTLDQILEERQVELASEWGERFFDLVRTGKAAEVLKGFVNGKSEFYPIPTAQKDLNPNL